MSRLIPLLRPILPWVSLKALILSVIFSNIALSAEVTETGIKSTFTARDIEFLSGFTLAALPALPSSPSNIYADNPKAIALGKQIFFDTQFSADGTVSCATCHQPEKYFSDGRITAKGMGITRRNTPSILGAAYGPWQYWDGRKDSLWSQALAPFEQENEHGFTRNQVAERITQHYHKQYTSIFGPTHKLLNKTESNKKKQQTQIFVNVGKALMAYERSLTISTAKFDRFIYKLQKKADYLSTKDQFSESEILGLRIFMGKGNCASCHNGPLFTNFEFHNTGAPELDMTQVDLGRYSGIEALREDEFTCLSKWSDATNEQCEEMNYLKAQGAELVGAFKTPSLRNVAATAPYMHSGKVPDLTRVIAHYNTPKPPYYDKAQHPNRPHFDIFPLGLNDKEQTYLIAFLQTLTSDIPDQIWPPTKNNGTENE